MKARASDRDGLAAAILAYNAGGDPERLAMKYAAMRASAFAFFRGACHRFYDRLPDLGRFADAPLAWSCGDLHLENFGSYRGETGLVYFDLNDFDEAILAPGVWDLVRVLASLEVAGRDLGLSSSETAAQARRFLQGFTLALVAGKPFWVEIESARGAVGALMQRLSGKSRKAQLAGRVEGEGRKARLITDGKHALKAPKIDRERIAALVEAHLETRPDGAFTILDVARRIAGTGSLGSERYVLLARRRKDDGLRLFDLKRARPSSSRGHVAAPQPAFTSEASRIVAVGSLMQAVAPAGLASLDDARGSFVLRQLQPSEDRLALDALARKPDDLADALAIMARLLAWAMLRAAARGGAAGPEALMAFGATLGAADASAALLDLVDESASRAIEDYRAFRRAFDAGAFVAPDVARAQ